MFVVYTEKMEVSHQTNILYNSKNNDVLCNPFLSVHQSFGWCKIKVIINVSVLLHLSRVDTAMKIKKRGMFW